MTPGTLLTVASSPTAVLAPPGQLRLSESTAPMFLMAGPRRTVLIERAHGTLNEPPIHLREHPDIVRLRAQRDTWIAGALPFDPATPSHLLLSQRVLKLGSWQPAFTDPDGTVCPRALVEAPYALAERALYESLVRGALIHLQAGSLRKVVLARKVELSLPGRLNWVRLLSALRDWQPSATTYGLRLGGDGQRAFVGSSPELVVSRRGSRVRCLPLAGSRPRSGDPQIDAERSRELGASSKDNREHRILIEQLIADLAPLVEDIKYDPQPTVLSTSSMLHLATPVTARLRDPRTDALDLVLALHPTAAVCGVPPQAALSFIRRQEGFDRGFYGGAVGYMDAAGDGEWVLAIRGATVDQGGDDSCVKATMLAGAGIVAGSDPSSEGRETSDKMRTTIRALSLATTKDVDHGHS